MKHAEDKIEHLVSRSLDGILSEEQQLELDRELIRCPEARQLMETSQDVDRLASQALGEALGQAPFTMDVDALPAQHGVRRSSGAVWLWRLVPGAVAAALIALVLARTPIDSVPSQSPPIVTTRQVPQPIPKIGSPSNVHNASDAPMRTVGSNRPAIKRNAGRDVFGVLGDDGNLYWIEVHRSRTVRKANSRPRIEF